MAEMNCSGKITAGRRSYRPLFRLLMLITMVALLLLPAGCQGQSGTTADTSNTTTASSASDPTPTPEPTVTPIPTPALPTDPLVESYFGPLPVASEVKAYQHNELRALYIGAAANVDETLEIARNTEVNAVVIDLKESNGVFFASKVPLAVDNGIVQPMYNLGNVVQRFHAENVKVIGRIVCFKDPMLAEARPDLTIKDKDGNALHYKMEGSKTFVNPFSPVVWQYNVDLAKEAIAMGVDEIQFDYVRFPTGGTTTGAKPYFGEEGTVPTRSQAINRFLQFARVQIQDELGIPLGADVFAIIIVSKLDGNNIGQDWDSLGLTGTDNVSPMIYPSHYANSSTTHYSGNGVGQAINGQNFTKPDLFPYDVMLQTLTVGKKAAEQPGYHIAIRPYLQAFTASYLPKNYYMTYDSAAIRAQIKAIRESGYNEWICWNPRAQYPQDAFDPES